VLECADLEGYKIIIIILFIPIKGAYRDANKLLYRNI